MSERMIVLGGSGVASVLLLTVGAAAAWPELRYRWRQRRKRMGYLP